MTLRWLGIVVLLAVWWPVGLAWAGPLALSVRAASDQRLYRIDLATGVATAVGALVAGDVRGLALHPRTGVLYGVNEGGLADQLVIVNPLTGGSILVRTLGIDTSNGGLAFDAAGNLFLTNELEPMDLLPRLAYRINLPSGQVARLGNQQSSIEALTWRDGILYGLGGNQLRRVHPGTAFATHIGNLSPPLVGSVGGLDFDRAGTLWGLNSTGQLFTVNPATGAVTLGATTLAGFHSLRVIKPVPVVTGTGSGGGPHVLARVDTNADGHVDAITASFFAYDPAFPGGVRVARCDVNGDGVADFVTAPGPGGGPHVKAFDGVTGATLLSFFAYDPAFTGGVFVACGDITGDGKADIVTGPGAGGGPHVKVFNGATGTLLAGSAGSFLAYDPAFAGGVRVAVCDVTGDTVPDIVTAAGPGGLPHVKLFEGMSGFAQGGAIGSFLAYDSAFAGGVFVACGDITGDGRADIVTAPGAGGGPHVKAFNGQTAAVLKSFNAYDPAFAGGVAVAVGDVDGNGITDIITAPGAGGGPHVKAFNGATPGLTPALLDSFFAYDPAFTGGVWVAGGVGF